MFDTLAFGGYLAGLRKRADMTQSDLADRLNLTRQAVSRYEVGDSFPDVSVLVLIAEVFHVSIDELIGSGNPSGGEAKLLRSIAVDGGNAVAESIDDVVGLAPLLKPSLLDKLSAGFASRGVDITNIVKLAAYLSEESTIALLRDADFRQASDELIGKLMPWLDMRAKYSIFQQILEGSMDWHLLRTLLPYIGFVQSQVEAAVLEGCLPWEALDLMHEAMAERMERRKNDPW